MNPRLLLNGSRLRNRGKNEKKRDNGEAIDIYNFEQKLKNAYSVLERASFEQQDKELIRAFADHLRAIGVSNKRLSKYIFHLKVIGENFPTTSFKLATRKDIERFMSWLRQEGYTSQTIADYIMVLKRFYKFVRFGNVDWDTPYPEEVRWLRKTIKANDLRQPEILSAKEIESMMKASSKLRDKTMLSVGYEAGLRATELLGMNLYDVSFDGKGAKIRVRGKTGERTVRLISSAPLLSRYIEEIIPTNGGNNKGGDNRPLWTSQSLNYRGRRLTWLSWSRILKQLAKDAGLGNRRIYNHLLRHSSATANAGFLTESELKLLYGWSGSSKMPSIYVHLRGKDLDQKLQAIYSGRQVEIPKPEFTPVICARCSEKNTPGFRFCSRCGTPLGQGELVQSSIEMESLKQKIKEMESLIQSSMSNHQSVSAPSQGSQVTPLPLNGAAES
jgi:integrase/recombinase XerD